MERVDRLTLIAHPTLSVHLNLSGHLSRLRFRPNAYERQANPLSAEERESKSMQVRLSFAELFLQHTRKRFLGLFSSDLGTVNTLIFSADGGISQNEPLIIALNTGTKKKR